MDNPEGQVTYPDKQDGRATYRLWHISLYALRFYLCFYNNLIHKANKVIILYSSL
jgi:hypothetical protein